MKKPDDYKWRLSILLKSTMKRRCFLSKGKYSFFCFFIFHQIIFLWKNKFFELEIMQWKLFIKIQSLPSTILILLIQLSHLLVRQFPPIQDSYLALSEDEEEYGAQNQDCWSYVRIFHWCRYRKLWPESDDRSSYCWKDLSCPFQAVD